MGCRPTACGSAARGASEASEAVGWIRMLGGLYVGFRLCSISLTIWSNVLLPNKVSRSWV